MFRVGLIAAGWGMLLSVCQSQAAVVHRWSFNEANGTNLTDSVGAAIASIVVLGGSDHTLTGQAVQLAGGNRDTADYIQLPPDAFDGLTDATIEIWAAPQPHSFPTWSRVIDMGDGVVDPTTANDNFRLSWSNGSNGGQQVFGLRAYPPALLSELVTPVDQLYHIAIVWTGVRAARLRSDGIATAHLSPTRSLAAPASRSSPTCRNRSSGWGARRSRPMPPPTRPIMSCASITRHSHPPKSC